MPIKTLILANVWPEPSSSAAGSRMKQLIQLFLDRGNEVHFWCTASENEFSGEVTKLGVSTKVVEMNDSSIDSELTELSPNLVVFDRFMVEEQFGWRVAEQCPDAVRVLNTEDFHSLRESRQQAYKKKVVWREEMLLSTDKAKREVAAIFRSDCSLIISNVEIDYLTRLFRVPEEILAYYPFITDTQPENIKSFDERQGFMTIGNFLHPPNATAVRLLKETIWPKIKTLLPKAEIHVYGAYMSDKFKQLENPKDGFFMHGRAKSLSEVFSIARVCLAPLTFGAGMKGKLLDSMQFGTPSVTTTVGAEAMLPVYMTWGGNITDNWDEFAQHAVQLHEYEEVWQIASENALSIYKTFRTSERLEQVYNHLTSLSKRLAAHREYNFTGTMLMHHRVRSTKFMSRWIEEKQKR